MLHIYQFLGYFALPCMKAGVPPKNGGRGGSNCQGHIDHSWPPLMASLGAGKKACWRITDLREVISVNVLSQISAASNQEPFGRAPMAAH